jgi:Icc-related predicted phosphoesterase
MSNPNKIRVAAVGDIHVKENHTGKWQAYFQELGSKADVLLLCGDLTDTGRPEEAAVLAEELKGCPVPVVGVLGNHDYESRQEDAVIEIIKEHMHLLDGDSVVINNVGFAGVKGFAGGFNRYRMPAYGEPMNKVFVQEVVQEAEKLDKALQHLGEEYGLIKKVVVLHYAPIEDTVLGEPAQIHAFLGSSYLAEPLEKHKVQVAFHGHAHAGSLKGNTEGGIPVYNVSVPVLRDNGLKVPYYLLEV